MELARIRTDPAVMSGGAWVDDLLPNDPLRMRVRPLYNPDYRRLQSKLHTSLSPQDWDVSGSLTAAAEDRIETECYLQTVLLEWDGLTENGEHVPFSSEKARFLLSDPEYREDFRQLIYIAAVRVRAQQFEGRETSGKNSHRRSAGT